MTDATISCYRGRGAWARFLTLYSNLPSGGTVDVLGVREEGTGTLAVVARINDDDGFAVLLFPHEARTLASVMLEAIGARPDVKQAGAWKQLAGSLQVAADMCERAGKTLH